MNFTEKQKVALRTAQEVEVKRVNHAGTYYTVIKADGKRISRRKWRPSRNVTNQTVREAIREETVVAGTKAGLTRPDFPQTHSFTIEKRNADTGSLAFWELRVASEKEDLTVSEALKIAEKNMSKSEYEKLNYWYEIFHIDKGFPVNANTGKTTSVLDKTEAEINLKRSEKQTRLDWEFEQ